ncbi:MAG: hypothetical protein B7Y45_06085 [Sphingomonas sp. 28-66-16]|nr:MAG: hypothetical protein B7Y45_06085 [Sphingomonas sp. 28-66-16]
MDLSADHDRWKAALAAILLQLTLGYLLVVGLTVGFPRQLPDALKLFVVTPPPTPAIDPPRPKHQAAPKPQGAASPANLKAKPTEVVAPPPVILPPTPPPVAVALEAGNDAAPDAGASLVRGPGTGSGGSGDGSGSGGRGDGDGGGSGTPLRRTGGRITGRDYPRGPFEAGIGGTLFVRYVVGVKGRVTDCTVVRSSGNAELDGVTCRLITERFRFKPRRNAAGKPIPSVIVEDHTWVVDRPPPDTEEVPGQGPDTP